ncbi:virulence RhuM family protein [Methylotuvimicrobium sp.]|uniref:virulence RhuM family protein n=1 Tax=Methylotuvimicrobium sp. TaxID=2822413 RepID=UPI003D662E1A
MTSTNQPQQIAIYQNEDGSIRIDVHLEQDTVWLSQAQMCELFDKNKRTISEPIRNIFKEGELQEIAVVRKFRTTASDGKTYEVNRYNLDVIISVGYRVKSRRGTQFRIWANTILKQYLLQGYALNEQKLRASNEDGEKRIADNTLVAFTLLIAESKPEEKDTIIKVIINLINGNNG